ncbi:MAG: TetR/AcrR family transcriptional regulator [Lachnospiraceae bacterium]|nr:TetR/AcrR family transcriptional regulator [Lachnospiraceae bacterium]
MDRRQKKTRDAIFKAFNQLLDSKNFSNITVQEIIDEANIGRSTFYSHFETKDELLKAMCTDLFHHVFSEELAKEKTHDFSKSKAEANEQITHILYHLQDSKKEIKGLLSGDSGELFMRYFKEYLSDVFKKYSKMLLKEIPQDYVFNYYVCSFSETVRWWICGEKAYTPEEVAMYYLRVVDSEVIA